MIIPVFNASNFLEKSIRSALLQQEVMEILVVDDGSTDNSFAIAHQIAQEFDRVKIFQHNNGINKGRSASRNLGIKNARCDYIAFLDADDYYLKNRFVEDAKVFSQNRDCVAVYNAVGFDYLIDYNDKVDGLYTVREKVDPEDLFLGLLDGKFGHFQIDGFTIKKEVLIKAGFFNENLKVAEDSDFFWKIVLSGKVYGGLIDAPVAIRVVHNNNIFYQKDIYKVYNYKMYESMLLWCAKNSIDIKIIDRILRRIWIIKHSENVSLIKEVRYWMFTSLIHKRILYSYLLIKYFPFVRRRKDFFGFLSR